MTVVWHKLGRVYCADSPSGWARAHAYCPTPFVRASGDRIRVLCAFRDGDQVGRCGWVDVSAADPTRVLAVSSSPVLDVGVPGSFDEHGVTPLSIVRLDDGTLRLYYAGWQRLIGIRYTLFTGVAESRDDGDSFRRVSRAPVLDRSDSELHIRSSVQVARDGDGWQMWYAAGSEWTGSVGTSKPRYALCHLRSTDGLTWPSRGAVCLQPESDELGFARPCVVPMTTGLSMWYSRRKYDGRYELGYAVSPDGVAWERHDERAGLALGPAGAWDEEMVGLAGLLRLPSRMLLFYNGNGYGETGFGVASTDRS